MFPILAVSFGTFMIPVLVIAVLLCLVFVGMAVASRYIKVPPNAIAVFYGRQYKYKTPDGTAGSRGFHIMTGGGRIVLPIVEKYQIMSTAAFQIEVSEDRIPTAKNVRVNVNGVATCKISDKPELMAASVQSFLGKSDEEVRQFVQLILNGHLRSIVGKLEIDQLLRKRDDFNRMVIDESTSELARLGFDLMSIVIKDINDTEGFIDALGKQAVAEVKRDAEVKVAEATRDTRIKVSEAERLAAEATAQNQAKIAEANKELAVKQATYKQETEQKRAVAEKAFAIADAEQGKALALVTAARDSATAEAQSGVQEKEAVRKEKELNATVLVEAEVQRKATLITADASRQAAIIKADSEQLVAEKYAKQVSLKADGDKAAAIAQGEGEASKSKAIAFATAEGEAAKTKQVTEAKAAGERAVLLAQAEGERAKLLAVAEGQRAKLLADAEGQLKMAQALKELNESAKLIIILDRLPAILKDGGDAGAKMLAEVFSPIGAAIGGIDKVTILDNGNGGKSVGGFAANVPNIVMGLLQQLKVKGIDISGLLAKAGLDVTDVLAMLSPGEKTGTTDGSAKTV